MMACGHSANAKMRTPDGDVPACAICFTTEQKPLPDLTNRRSRCGYGCGRETDSSFNLPFFEYRPNGTFDAHYCGCRGWD